jgi:hypothetical protein
MKEVGGADHLIHQFLITIQKRDIENATRTESAAVGRNR